MKYLPPPTYMLNKWNTKAVTNLCQNLVREPKTPVTINGYYESEEIENLVVKRPESFEVRENGVLLEVQDADSGQIYKFTKVRALASKYGILVFLDDEERGAANPDEKIDETKKEMIDQKKMRYIV